jgi:hypothetical protein
MKLQKSMQEIDSEIRQEDAPKIGTESTNHCNLGYSTLGFAD